jgi:hypothetical protein
MPTLRNPKFKVERAKTHLDSLDKFIKTWIESKPYRFLPQDDLERGEYRIVVETEHPPFEAALIAGDFICCLRASLDWLAWQLAALTTKAPSNRICFPIYGESTLDTQVSITKSTFGVPDSAISLIKSFQPYNSGDNYKYSDLWVLHRLWNIDKHRHVPLHSGVLELTIPPRCPRPIRSDMVDDHGVLVFRLTDKPHVNFDPSPTTQIYFGDESEGIRVTICDFFRIYKTVSESVIPAFASFLT